jgi:hypothetical protein
VRLEAFFNGFGQMLVAEPMCKGARDAFLQTQTPFAGLQINQLEAEMEAEISQQRSRFSAFFSAFLMWIHRPPAE